MATLTSRSSSIAASSPASSAQSEKSTRSVKAIASSVLPLPRPCASEIDGPDLDRAEPGLAEHPGPLAGQVRDRPAHRRGCAVGALGGDAALAVARQHRAQRADDRQQARVLVQPLARGRQRLAACSRRSACSSAFALRFFERRGFTRRRFFCIRSSSSPSALSTASPIARPKIDTTASLASGRIRSSDSRTCGHSLAGRPALSKGSQISFRKSSRTPRRSRRRACGSPCPPRSPTQPGCPARTAPGARPQAAG